MTTIDFYNEHAQDFYHRMVNVDMHELYAPFLALLPVGAHILDAGCGSGRDGLYFKQHGYQVIALDASAELVKLSSQLLQQPVIHQTFQELDFNEIFDGIWACASLLHVPRNEIDDVLGRLTQALKPGGILFASFKYGDTEQDRDGRLFNSYDEPAFAELLTRHPRLALIKSWTSGDLRNGRQEEQWLDVLVRKVQTLRLAKTE